MLEILKAMLMSYKVTNRSIYGMAQSGSRVVRFRVRKVHKVSKVHRVIKDPKDPKLSLIHI